MKRILAVAMALFLAVMPVSCLAAKSKATPTPKPSVPITLSMFLEKYQEGLDYTLGMLARKSESISCDFSNNDDGSIGFTFVGPDSAFFGTAYADTTVIKEGYMLSKKADGAIFASIALMYALGNESDVFSSLAKMDQKAIENIAKKPITINGYKVSLVDSEVAGWSKTWTIEKIDGNVSMEAVGDVKYPDELLATSRADGVALSSGEYDVGAHIPAGEYKVTPIKSANLFVYRGGALKTSEYLNVDDKDEIGRLVLQAGDRIEITGGKLQFTPFK